MVFKQQRCRRRGYDGDSDYGDGDGGAMMVLVWSDLA